MNDDHPTGPDPSAPYRHPEMAPQMPRQTWGESEDQDKAFFEWLTWLARATPEAPHSRIQARLRLPLHLRRLWDQLDREARVRETMERIQAERGEV
jgi:hypothetical protein